MIQGWHRIGPSQVHLSWAIAGELSHQRRGQAEQADNQKHRSGLRRQPIRPQPTESAFPVAAAAGTPPRSKEAIAEMTMDALLANRIPLAMTCLLVETGGKKILVETGAGTPAKYDAKEQGFFKFSPHWILDSLRAVGVERETIDYVILTHLHFDHAGGGTMPDGRGASPACTAPFPHGRHGRGTPDTRYTAGEGGAGFLLAHWCGDAKCEKQIQEEHYLMR
jgi:hypothetical protein